VEYAMPLERLSEMLGWMTVINMGILTGWFLVFISAHEWMYQLHKRWFQLSVAGFDTIHYTGMAYYKIGIFLLNLTPFLALQIVV
jgi:hypothetical protein